MKRKAIFLILLLLLLLVNAAQAGSSASYALDWMVPLTGGGGGRAASASYIANITVGQTSLGEPASTHNGIHLGFWQAFIQSFTNHFIWLPVLLK